MLTWRKLFLFFLAMAVAIAVFLPALSSWVFVYSLTHPGCATPEPILTLPEPEEHWLRTADGLQVRVWYYPSRNRASIIALGGSRGSLGENLPPVEALVQQGFGVVQVDSRSCAQPPSPVTLGYREVEEAGAVLDFLLARSEVEEGKIGAFGFSMGSAASIRLAAQRTEVAALVVDGGYSNLGENFYGYGGGGFLTRWVGFLTSQAFRTQTGIDPYLSNPVEDLAEMDSRPVLFIYGEGEYGSPAELLLASAGDSGTLWIVPGGSHGRNHLTAPGEYEQRVVEFFLQALFPKTSPRLPD